MTWELGKKYRALTKQPNCIPIERGGIIEIVEVHTYGARARILSGEEEPRFANTKGWSLNDEDSPCLFEPVPEAKGAVRFKRLDPDATLPTRAKPGDAGMDVTCVDDGKLSVDQSQITYRTGLAMEIPDGYVGLLFPRSSICKTSLALANSVGVIDSGYRGEVKAVFNRRYHEDLAWSTEQQDMSQVGVEDRPYKKGDRIVQLIILPVPQFEPQWADELSSTEREDGGFGSSGR